MDLRQKFDIVTEGSHGDITTVSGPHQTFSGKRFA